MISRFFINLKTKTVYAKNEKGENENVRKQKRGI